MLNINTTELLSLNTINNINSISNNNSISFSNTLENISSTKSLDDIFEKAAQKYNVPVSLLKAIGKAESGFNPKAVSPAGAQGVMQLMPATAKSLGVTDSFDAEQNIMGGAKYISQMLNKYDGDVKLALAAYNAGSGNVAKYGGIPPFKETQNYVKKVMSYAGEDLKAGNYTNSNIQDNTLKGKIEKNILDFDDFTIDDYLLFVEYLKNDINNSLFNTLSKEINENNYITSKNEYKIENDKDINNLETLHNTDIIKNNINNNMKQNMPQYDILKNDTSNIPVEFYSTISSNNIGLLDNRFKKIY